MHLSIPSFTQCLIGVWARGWSRICVQGRRHQWSRCDQCVPTGIRPAASKRHLPCSTHDVRQWDSALPPSTRLLPLKTCCLTMTTKGYLLLLLIRLKCSRAPRPSASRASTRNPTSNTPVYSLEMYETRRWERKSFKCLGCCRQMYVVVLGCNQRPG